MPTYKLIATNTVGSGGASSITFSSIPATYTDLVLKTSERFNSSGTVNGKLTFNGTSTGYSERLLYVSGSTPTSASQSTTSFAWATVVYGTDAPNDTFNNSEIYIPNYATANYKTILTDSVAEKNDTPANIWLDCGLWSNTAAINSLTMTISSGSYVQYSTFTLYGISNA
jgi:hypothetical protein